MLRPKLPDNPTTAAMNVQRGYARAPSPARPVAPHVALGFGAVAAVVVVGVVLTALLLAIAVTAASVAVCAVVLRSLLSHSRSR